MQYTKKSTHYTKRVYKNLRELMQPCANRKLLNSKRHPQHEAVEIYLVLMCERFIGM